MRILLIHTSYQLKGGEDTVFKQEFDLLSKFHEVDVLHFKNKKNFSGAFQFLTSIWNLKKNKEVKEKIKLFSPDIIHLHNWHFALGPLVIRGIKKMGIPLLLTLHNFRLICPSGTLFHNKKLYECSLKQDFPWHAIKEKVYRNSYLQTFWLGFVVWFHKKIGTWKMVDTYVCPSLFMIDLFVKSSLKIEKDCFTVKQNFSETIELNKGIKPQENFLFVGRLSEEKGIKCLLEAFKKTDNVLKIIGKGPLKKLVEDFSVKHTNIIYLGFSSKEVIAKEMQEASALIFPSIWYEPFGLTITEAFSNKCAVLASNIGAPKSIIQENINGFHFNYGDSEDLKKVIEKWKNLPENQKEKIRENCFDVYQNKYSAQKQHQLIEDIYKRVINK